MSRALTNLRLRGAQVSDTWAGPGVGHIVARVSQELYRSLAARQEAAGGLQAATIFRAMADEQQIPLEDQLKEIGAQLDWVRGYL